MSNKYDFAGWATKNDVLCSDGRTIRSDAFKDCDGKVVPLVWNHQHDSVDNVLGHALLENRKDGVYCYCTFNKNAVGDSAKELVKHGDVTSLSIYANQLRQNGGNVVHGIIREVSLVLAGANPVATIDTILEHSDGASAIVWAAEDIELCEEDDTLEHACCGKPEEEKKKEKEEKELEHSKEEEKMAEGNEKTVQDVFDSFNEEQKNVFYFLLQKALEENGKSNESGDENMKHNAFESDYNNDNYLSHSEMEAIFSDAKRTGSLKDAVLQHGITDIEYLFPDNKNINNVPDFIKRDTGWVKKVMGAVKHTPFSRIKSIHADITEDDARALGYLPGETHRDSKGNLVDANGNRVMKKEEVFSLLKRVTNPTTIYKKQRIDRNDVIDITDFDVVAWIKAEMREMLDEEIARAILIGDGRLASSDDKIDPLCIRPIWTDSDLYVVHTTIEVEDEQGGLTSLDNSVAAKAFIRACIKSRKLYKGSGNPSLYTTEDILTECLLLEDAVGRVIYDSEEKLRTALRVKEIVTVPVMENQKREVSGVERTLMGIIVNLDDYNVGADKGGEINMFDDFDIDYNAQKYLIETRCSGAMIKPHAAIAIEAVLDEE